MLKWYAELFKFSGKELTPKALRRTKMLMLLSLPAYPLLATAKIGQFNDNVDFFLNIVLVISGVCLLAWSVTKFMNRFWSRDQYLDEWELKRKHESMAFVFQVMMYSFGAILLLITVLHRFEFAKQISLPTLDVYSLGIIFAGFLSFGYYVMQAYLLFTIKPMVEDSPKRKTGITV